MSYVIIAHAFLIVAIIEAKLKMYVRQHKRYILCCITCCALGKVRTPARQLPIPIIALPAIRNCSLSPNKMR